MINYHAAMATFSQYSHDDKRIKVTAMVQAIFDKSGKMEKLLQLLTQTVSIPDDILTEIYDALMSFGREMDDITIAEKLGKTQARLKKIWDAEAKERAEEEIYLEALLKRIDTLPSSL